MKSEWATWRDELEPPVKPTLAERIANRWGKKPASVEPDHFVWRDTANLIPIDGETL